ncbi:MAG: hypothetical protein AAB694_01785, partial [Patescibacteria group bacterium]
KALNLKLRDIDDTYLNAIIPLVQERIKTLKEFDELAGFFFEEPVLDKGLFGNEAIMYLDAALKVIRESEWQLENLQKSMLVAIKDNNFKTGDFFMSVRVALTGSRITPPIVESIIILGKEKTQKRIQAALELLK